LRIRFNVTAEDFAAFSKIHATQSPDGRRQRFLGTGIFSVFVVFLFLDGPKLVLDREWWSVPENLFKAAWVSAGLFVPIFLGSYFLFGWASRWQASRAARQLLKEEDNQLLIGWQEMELQPGRLLINVEFARMDYDLRGILRIDIVDDYALVYNSTFSGFVIPTDSNRYPDNGEFVKKLVSAWSLRDEPRSLVVESSWKASSDCDGRFKKPIG
jgi:hypothetical protein